jgi:hypothetical protein
VYIPTLRFLVVEDTISIQGTNKATETCQLAASQGRADGSFTWNNGKVIAYELALNAIMDHVVTLINRPS